MLRIAFDGLVSQRVLEDVLRRADPTLSPEPFPLARPRPPDAEVGVAASTDDRALLMTSFEDGHAGAGAAVDGQAHTCWKTPDTSQFIWRK